MIELSVFHNSQFLKNYTLDTGDFNIGSSDESFISLNYPTVSKTHALLSIQNDSMTVQDLASKNGTYYQVQNKKMPVQGAVKIDLGSSFWIGPFELRVRSAQERGNTRTDLLEKYIQTYLLFFSENENTAIERMRNLYQEDPNYSESIELLLKNEFQSDGPLCSVLADPQCKEIIINAFDKIYVDIGNGLVLSELKFLSQYSFESWTHRQVLKNGRRLDLQSPICEATLSNGARFHAVIPPISHSSINVSIRKFGSAPITIESALESKWMNQKTLELLQFAVHHKLNCIISGGTSAGKTSLLNFLCQFFEPSERIITIEDTLELSPKHENTVRLVSRKSNADGIGEISIRKLIQSSLRMRPDRIIVGECRGDEVIEMLQALNTGHPGSLTTIHANTAQDAIHRLELLCLLGTSNVTIEALRAWIRHSVDMIIHVDKTHLGTRRISQISVTKSGLQKLHSFRNLKISNEGELYDIHN